MSFFQAYVSSFINQINSIDPSRSAHQKKDVMLRFLKLSVFTILILIVFFLIYRVRILYHQHLKYQRLQRDEAEVTFYFWYSFIQIQTLSNIPVFIAYLFDDVLIYASYLAARYCFSTF